MEKTIYYSKVVLALVGGYFASLLGGADKLLFMLLCLVTCDLIFGAAKGTKNKNFASSIFFWGLVNKAVIFMIVAIMVQVDSVLGKFGILRNSFIIWFAICEGASIIENTATLGIPWPDGLLNILIQVRKGFSINLSKIVQQIIDNYKLPKTEGKSDE